MIGKRVYIFGPMSSLGLEGQWNFPAFKRAALYLRALGAIPVCPAAIDEVVWGFYGDEMPPPKMKYQSVLSIDFAVLKTCEMGYGLIGWSKSLGSRWERSWMEVTQMPVEYEAGAERGVVGYVADPTWEQAYIAELENYVVAHRRAVWDAMNGRVDKVPTRDDHLLPYRERASQSGLEPKPPQPGQYGHDYEEE
jgi:hypothetical protein